ncbi:uncharacterized protein LOC109121966 [Vitis vinifera]|nr:uncharacterized protein LOC109121966 [Vitis vinifera]
MSQFQDQPSTDRHLQEQEQEQEAQGNIHDPELIQEKGGDNHVDDTVTSQEPGRPSLGELSAVEENEGFRSPTSIKHKIPAITECPPAPRKPTATRAIPMKRRISKVPRRLQFEEFENGEASNHEAGNGDASWSLEENGPRGLDDAVIGNVEEKLSQKVHDIQEEVKDAYTKTKEKVSEKTHMVQEGVKEAVEKAKHAAKPTCDLRKTIVEDVAGNISKIEAASREQMGQRGRGERQGEEKDGVDTVKSTLHEFQKKGQHDFINRVYDVVNYMLSTDAIGSLTCVIHILGFATAYGVCVWVTFFSSFVLAGALPNQQFGIVQSKIYPFYFKIMASCVGLALLGHALSQGEKVLLGKPDLFQGHALLATLHIILINLLYLEPRATKVMFERIRVENEERKGQESSRVEPGKEGEPTTGASGPQVMGRLDQETVNNQILELNEMLKKLNAYSSFLNILTLMVLKLHLVYLVHRLYMTC